MKNKLTLLSKLSLILMSIICFGQVNAQSNLQFSTRVSASSDDAEEQGSNGSTPGKMDLTSSDLELVRDGNDGDQFVGIRFTNITIPQGAIIDSAFIQFTVDEDDTLTGAKFIRAEAVDNSTTFLGTNGDISSRPTTQDSIIWNNIPTWPVVGASGIDQRTPNIGSVISAVINRAGWASGNALNVIITGTGERVAESYDGASASAPELIVHYSVPIQVTFPIIAGDDDAEQNVLSGGMSLSSSDLEFTTDGSSIQAIGMRFQNVTIPNNSTILNAYIQFQVDETNSSDTVNVAWAAEDTDNAAQYTATTNNISGRTYMAIPTFQNMLPAWSTAGVAGADQRTVDLASQVQAVVNRTGWVSGNAMAFAGVDPSVLSVPGYNANSSKRTAESFNGSTSGAPKLVVTYIPPSSYVDGIFPVSKGSSWKYDDTGVDLSATSWNSLGYNDSTWAFGDAILGYNNGNEVTTLSYGPNSSNKQITTYLRYTFNAQNVQQYDSLIFDVLRDDGVVVYLNGTEVFRQNMPTGTVGYNTLSSTAVGGSDETTYFTTVVNNTLLNGKNVIAVELHQQSASSSDLSFDMEVRGKLPPLATSSYPIQSGDDWNYLDNGSDLGSTNWKALNYNDTNWAYGPSPLGYSNASNTTISYGPNPNDKYITYYFRKRFNVANHAALADSLILGLRRDDGAVVYINGTEVVRSNMPAGPINFRTLSSTIVSGADETTFYTSTISKNVLIQGDNIIAVEVHQRDSSSSDLSFDFNITEKPFARKSCAGPNDTHISCYTSLYPTSQGPNFHIPNTHAFQVLIEQGDTYSNTGVRTTVPGNNDFTGYIGRLGSSIDGFLGINHENTPGGFSILDMRYNDTSKLWTVDSSQAVNFYNNDLVTTTRNCSGGITPWGTFISSEETSNAGDGNNDGYQDVGWQVEIDPITRKVKEYGTPGKQEKLWALGRMSHENIAVANDSITAYEGVDAGSGCLFKFIANNPTDLSAGTLYALRLDSGRASNGEPLSSTGTWIVVPNTTQADRNNSNALAISLGATTFNGIEDVEIGTIDDKIYFTAKGSNRVYRFRDLGTTTFNEFETFVGGRDYLINYGNGIVSEPWSRGNDNLCFDDLGNLYVLQDGDRDHVWMVGPNHTQASPQVDIFAKLPAGSEPCGMTFTPDYKFMFLSVQHPSGSNNSTIQMDASGYAADMAKSTTVVIARKEYLGNYAPAQGATNLSFTTNACDSVNLSFIKGNGTGHLVVVKEDSLVNVNPLDGITYNANTSFKQGDNLGQNNYAVYDGLDSNITIKGLQQNTKYHVSIFEYNEAPNKYYLINAPAKDSTTTAAVATSSISGNFNTSISATETYTVNNTTGSSYVWDAGQGTITSGQGTNQIQVTWPSSVGNSDLKVVETNASECEGDTVIQNVLYGSVGIESFNLNNSISVAPNPTDGRTTVSVVGLEQSFDIIIYDLVGKKVIEERRLNNSYEVDLSNHNKGTYIIQIISGNKSATKRLIVR